MTDPALLDRHRIELTAYCYRMLGSGFEAEDAVQETLVRAWRHRERYDESRATVRSWLYSIATNVCFDMLRSAQRRARAMDLGPAARPGTPLGAPLPEHTWLQPVPDDRVLREDGDPAEVAVGRETVRLAFVAALQLLPPRQRAVLILRDVLRWKADEVAALLETSTASVTSAVQRARATLGGAGLGEDPSSGPLDERQRALLDRYVTAFEAHDVHTLVALLHSDATMSMPPFAWWLSGRDDIAAVVTQSGQPCEHDRLLPVRANGGPAFGQYRDGVGFALVLLEPRGDRIAHTTTYLDAPRLFPFFGLPMSFPEPARTT
ncbi:sigma-70 family RNA polymerase sigma factor [Prauserella cavernicola]|uniref:Sigma-70 family RNA polymerase sigma factor n=1 Tax=Prauserella cavernicola TaxID=2800127 RepID=A0A934QRE4_9PSEU|nr:sigma-70 family RNA polymerase sigma factor [Prauserella cavernicola]MBK1784862.1 sigma-70 family RNA polymerase sigma factor [Prauserella cavernicola]